MKVNVNTDIMIKNVKPVALNTKIGIVVLNMQRLKII